jgi:cyclophilin family peptidyl-prolyl cis-trans isomerase
MVTENQVSEPQGTLAMAAATLPSGSQFYIVVGKGPAPNYNVFGMCTTDVAIAISNVARDANDKPKTAVHMQRVDIARCSN